MSNILKVTTPPTGYDNNAINKQTTSQQAENMSVKNPVDPSRVVRADGRNQANNQQDAAQKGVSAESNFGNFVQSLRDLPKLEDIMTKMIFSGMANVVESGISKGTAAEIQALFRSLNMSPEELADFVKARWRGRTGCRDPYLTCFAR